MMIKARVSIRLAPNLIEQHSARNGAQDIGKWLGPQNRANHSIVGVNICADLSHKWGH